LRNHYGRRHINRTSRGRKGQEKKHGLRHDKMDQYISETGQVYSITELILKYEKLILSEKTFNGILTGRENSDVIYRLSKMDNSYIIEVFIGEHAERMETILKG